jgi:tetratricopeptide (TPR) repeat protein
MPLARLLVTGLLPVLLLVPACSDDGDDPAAGTTATASSPAATGTPDAALAQGLVTKGLEAVEAGDPDEAGRLFSSVLDLDPDNVFAHYNLGYLAQLDGEIAPALEHYTAALDAQPDFAPALYNLAILTEPVDLPAAVDLYRRVVASTGGDAGTYFRLGHALVELDQAGEGRDLVEQAIALDASLADAPVPTYS